LIRDFFEPPFGATKNSEEKKLARVRQREW